MNDHLFKHELIRQYWIIEISKEEWQIRIKDIVITYLGTILCESEIHVRPSHDKNINLQSLHCKSNLNFHFLSTMIPNLIFLKL
jgi:hypothetical protein